jgi:ubiquinone biosynthesis protein COQ9
MDKQKAASDIITYALPLVPFEGWSQTVLQKAALAAGYKKTDAIRVFPGGAIEAVDRFAALADERMLADVQNYHLDTMKIRARIALCVRLRLEAAAPHREAVRKAVALQATPLYAHHALRTLYNTVDAIWHAAGDTATDFNFYSKRLLLAGVYSATLLHWLDDKSPGFENSWAFLDRRIENVMAIEKTKHKIKHWLESLAG